MVVTASSLMFGFINNYWWLLGARAIQGIGSSCLNIGGTRDRSVQSTEW